MCVLVSIITNIEQTKQIKLFQDSYLFNHIVFFLKHSCN